MVKTENDEDSLMIIAPIDSSSHSEFDNHHLVERFEVPEAGLRGYRAIHRLCYNEVLERLTSDGGTRFYPYKNEDDALTDVLRLSKGMSYKNALINSPFGGAKAVIVGDPQRDKTQELLLAFARVHDELDGAMITGPDMGIGVADASLWRAHTRWIAGCSEALGGCGDTAEPTAIGVFMGIHSWCLYFGGAKGNSGYISGKTCAVQGFCGKVGTKLTRFLLQCGAKVLLCDVCSDASKAADGLAREFGADNVVFKGKELAALFDEPIDIFIPCAVGGILNSETIPFLEKAGCRLVAGSANNQLATPQDGDELWGRGVWYAPDYVINAGGAIYVADESGRGGFNIERAQDKLEIIHVRLSSIFAKSGSQNIAPHHVADRMAQERIVAWSESG